jgi:coenzyme PQQ biosynthesis protein PqqD
VRLTSRPRLVPRARLRDDPRRGCTVLLSSEEVYVLNDSAAAVLRLCDGARDVGDVVCALVATTAPDRHDVVAGDVLGFLRALAERGLLADATPTEPAP